MLNKELKIVVRKGVENPFRPGTGVYKRAGAVLRSNGKPVAAALRSGARTSTVMHLAKAKVIQLRK